MTLDWKTATEEQLRDAKAPWPKTLAELTEVVEALREREHHYGTCVYAMSIAATASFNYMASALGVTGFQAECADLDVLKRTRGYKHGFRVIDYSNLLYPQYDRNLRLSPEKMLAEDDDLRRRIVEEAKKSIAEAGNHVAPRVLAHWEHLVAHYDTKPADLGAGGPQP